VIHYAYEANGGSALPRGDVKTFCARLAVLLAFLSGCTGDYPWSRSNECYSTQCSVDLGPCHDPVRVQLLNLHTSTTHDTAIEVAVRRSGVLRTLATDIPACALSPTCADPVARCDVLEEGMYGPFEVSLACEEGRVREVQSAKLPYGTDASVRVGRAIVEEELVANQIRFTAFDQNDPTTKVLIRTVDEDGARVADEEFDLEASGELSLHSSKYFFDAGRPIRLEGWRPCDDEVGSCLFVQRFYLWNDDGEVARMILDDDGDGLEDLRWDIEYEDGNVSRVVERTPSGDVVAFRIASCCSHEEACAAFRDIDESSFSSVE